MDVALLLILAVAGALYIVSLRQPDTFRVVRMRYMLAPRERIFPLINSLREHSRWSPFEKDPAMKKTYAGADSGVGAKYAWDGNHKAGAGHLEILQSVPPARVIMRLSMLRPMKAVNEVVYELDSIDGGTEVTWSMSGRLSFVGKIMNTVIDCERLVGADFEKGLTSLKSIVEKDQ